MRTRTIADKLTKVIAENDQDLAEAKSWFTDLMSDDGTRYVELWKFLQSEFSNPFLEVASRLASLKLVELLVDHLREKCLQPPQSP